MKSPQTEDGYTRLANELLEAFSRLDASGSAWRVFMVIIRKTYGFHKKSDKISLTQFEDMSNLARKSVCRGLNELILNNIITVEKCGYINIYEVQKDYSKWGSVKPVTSDQNDTKSSVKPVTKTSDQNDTYKRKKDNKDISKQSLQLNKKDMTWKNRASDNDDDLPSIDMDSQKEIVDNKAKETNEKVTALIEWAEKLRGKRFLDLPTQRKMLHEMRTKKLSPQLIKDTYVSLLHSDYWKSQDRLPDFKTVLSALKNKK